MRGGMNGNGNPDYPLACVNFLSSLNARAEALLGISSTFSNNSNGNAMHGNGMNGNVMNGNLSNGVMNGNLSNGNLSSGSLSNVTT